LNLSKATLLILLVMLLSACVSPTRSMPPLAPPETQTAYRLGPGDTLQITVFGEGDLTGSYPVSANGTVDVPLIGSVPATGLTLSQLQQDLVQRLDAKAVRSPNVTVSVTTYRPFFILGEVKNPGSYPYVPGMTVLTAVAIAGGFTYRAAQGEISVTRVGEGRSSEARATRDARVLPGDVVNIFERHL
jgi:polysaccharide export outer membrane protein